ncbi:MAG TPA: hypothetical protein VF656_13355 [Pyrinomonadaceae bacterium]|jgi:uncharacterized coiled-coil protein SlyX
MADEDRLSRTEEIVANLAVLARDSNRRLDLLVELVRSHEERIDELEEVQANSERKIAALADAQIRTEETIANLASQIAELTVQQSHTDQRLDALINIVRESRDGKPPQES